jgi:hypothetical protein
VSSIGKTTTVVLPGFARRRRSGGQNALSTFRLMSQGQSRLFTTTDELHLAARDTGSALVQKGMSIVMAHGWLRLRIFGYGTGGLHGGIASLASRERSLDPTKRGSATA